MQILGARTSDNEFWILCEKSPEAPLLRIKTTKERATKMAELMMEEGMAFGAARSATK